MHFSRSNQSKKASSSESSNSRTQMNQQLGHDNNIDDESKSESAFECNICLETARDAVVSLCGHLFCWPCLHQWMYSTDNNGQSHNTCPVCKSAISRDKTIPIYGRGGNSDRQDPRDKLPPRPPGQRTEIPNQQNQFPFNPMYAMGGAGAQIFGFDGGFHMSFGITSLPHYIFGLLQEYTSNDRYDEAGNERLDNTDFLWMRLFAIFGIICIIITLHLC